MNIGSRCVSVCECGAWVCESVCVCVCGVWVCVREREWLKKSEHFISVWEDIWKFVQNLLTCTLYLKRNCLYICSVYKINEKRKKKVSSASVHLFRRSNAYKIYGLTDGQGDFYIPLQEDFVCEGVINLWVTHTTKNFDLQTYHGQTIRCIYLAAELRWPVDLHALRSLQISGSDPT